MTKYDKFTMDEARTVGAKLGVDWKKSKFELKEFWMGMHVELEHGKVDPATNVTDDDPLLTGKIALAHLNEYPDYYTRLDKMEKEAEKKWG